jgi:integrase
MATTQSSSPSGLSQNPDPSPAETVFDPGSIPVPPLHGYQIRADMSFAEAAAAFDEHLSCPVEAPQARYRAFRTMRDIRTKIKALSKFFGRLKLRDIHIGHLREYQKVRSSNERGLWAHTAGANKINAELGLVLRILKLGEAYSSTIESYYVSLQEDECEIPKALSQEEQDRFLGIAASRPEWAIVHWYSLLAVHIAFSSDELRTLRQGDINLAYQIVAVNRKAGKNKFRRREVPLLESRALWALKQLLDRSIALVGQSPEKYLFPARVVRNQFNGDFHMSETGVRKQFEAVRDAANLKWFQLNGWRHTAITRMAEAGIPIAIIMERAGHSSPKMSAHYTHISMQAQRMAMQGMTHGRRVTSGPPEPPPQAPPPPLNLMDPAIQAEIARQVALALQQRFPVAQPAMTVPAATNRTGGNRKRREKAARPRLVMFPGGAR